jgi:hypothetical protein
MKSEALHNGLIARALLILLLAVAMGFLPPQTSFAADLYVSKSGSDSGNCQVTDCLTVAHAVTQASSGDIINIAAGVYYENLELGKNLSFYGAGMDVTILDGNFAGPVISNLSYSLAVRDMTIRNGKNETGGGGGIKNWGTSLTLTRVKVTGNSGADGGGILSNAPLAMTDCVVSGNESKYDTNSSGGGIFITGASGTATLTNVTLNGNTALRGGGGIHNQMAGTVTMQNVTITDNYALQGGAILSTNDSVMNLTNCTIAHNSYYVGGFGPGMLNYATTNYRNTIMSANGGENCVNGGTSHTTNSYGGNLDSGDSCIFDHASDVRNTDPLLGPLGDNGGYVETIALLTGSPAIDTGANTGFPSTDARGVARPQDGNTDGSALADMGAFERCGHKPAGIIGFMMSFYYDSISEAYADIVLPTVLSLQTYQFNENLLFSKDVNITLKGGFDCEFDDNTGKFSVLKGSLTINNGKVTIANLKIR